MQKRKGKDTKVVSLFTTLQKIYQVCGKLFEPAHNKTYNKTCVTSKDPDQTAQLCSLIRVFTDHVCLLQPPGYPKRDQIEPLTYWVDYKLI